MIYYLYEQPRSEILQAYKWCSIESSLRLGKEVTVYTENLADFKIFPEVYKPKLSVTKLDYKEMGINQSDHKNDLKNLIPLTLIYQKGGIFSAMDILYLSSRAFENSNKFGAMSDYIPEAEWKVDYLNFDKGHKAAGMMMVKYTQWLNEPETTKAKNPFLLTKVIQDCSNSTASGIREMCGQVEHESNLFYQNIYHGEFKELLLPFVYKTDAYEDIVYRSVGVNLVNVKDEKVKFGSLMHVLFSFACPRITSQYLETLFE